MEATQGLKETGVVAEAGHAADGTVNAGPVSDVVEETNTSDLLEEKHAAGSLKSSPSPPRRPLTRSQTGTVTKRRTRDDSDHIGENKKPTPVPRKRQKPSSTPVGDNAGPPPQDSSSTSSPNPALTREVSLVSSTSSATLPSNGNQITFYHTSSASDDQAEGRLPRSRATLPTPIPNLTKKSRGRRVPTQDSAINDPDKKDHRLYVCTVDGCGKCFHRGEHLKRHIRSIHTHEKPFKCTYPLCQKYFNRHDNLLQHLKVHREPMPKEDADETHADSVPPRQRQSQSRSSSSPPPVYRRQRSYSPMDEPESPVAPAVPRTIYNVFPRTTTYGNYPSSIAFSPDTKSISLLADLAVSSLRTELPQSPVDTRGSALGSNPH